MCAWQVGRAAPWQRSQKQGFSKFAAQQQLKRRFLRLVFRGQQLDPCDTLSKVGLKDGDNVAAVVQPVKLASTVAAFALHAEGGAALAWGHLSRGGG